MLALSCQKPSASDVARSDRLFRLLHLLRSLPAPVTAERLAEETGVSPRTLYRDIDALRAGGALIDGAPGYGYTLTEDPALPPQMFTRLEMEAVMLGLGQIRDTGDAELIEAADTAQAKIIATLPERVQRQAAHAGQMVYRYRPAAPAPANLPLLRRAVWEERAVDIAYEDREGALTQRRMLPLQLVFLDHEKSLLAWCGLRQDFRQFLPVRMRAVTLTEESFRPRRVALLRDYIEQLSRGARRDE